MTDEAKEQTTGHVITLYGREPSGNTYKARLLMAFLEVPYHQIEIRLGAGGRNDVDDAYRAMNPRGQVPTLIDGETVLWGSTAALVYLASRYDSSGRWLPRDDPERLARVMQWLELAQNEVIGLVRARAMILFGMKGDIDAARRDGKEALRVLEQGLSGAAWLAGDGPTIADIACFPYAALAPQGGFDLAAWPAVSAWIARIRALSGYVPLPGE
jgi:glutathione S-transferase